MVQFGEGDVRRQGLQRHNAALTLGRPLCSGGAVWSVRHRRVAGPSPHPFNRLAREHRENANIMRGDADGTDSAAGADRSITTIRWFPWWDFVAGCTTPHPC